MNNPRTRRLKEIIFGQTLVGILILVVAGYLIIYSLGYKVNFTSRKIVKTGLIVVSVNPRPDHILVNNKDMGSKDNGSFTLEPGTYDIVVKKYGYHDWTMTSRVEPELVNYYKYIELFKNDNELSNLDDESKKNYLNTPSTALVENAPKGLSSNDFEIWISDKITARFSTPISNVSWYPDFKHVVFQQGDEIKIIDEFGKNETVLVKLPNDQPAKYAIGSKRTEIYIYQSESYYFTKIQ